MRGVSEADPVAPGFTLSLAWGAHGARHRGTVATAIPS
jgi:hypothetical protein